MKKINLSIPKPCHEDWGAMTPSDKGRFCGSCQETVIDFTTMSDRQLAEFFKKPPSSVCGHVYDDQLNRDIVIPKKRIPWVKYFFQIAWPAFVLFLKSCGVKHDTKDKVNVESKANDIQEHSFATLGMMMPEITPVDTSAIIEEKAIIDGAIVGDIDIVRISDSVAVPIDSSVKEDSEIVYQPMDTVLIQSYSASVGRMVTTGAVSICKAETIQEEGESRKQEFQIEDDMNFKVYPNPVRAGSSLNVSFESANDFSEIIQILSSSGQVISQLKQNGKTAITNIQIPWNCAAGIYFLRLVTKNKEVKTTKVIVTK
jgi:hypothetical protein